MKVFYLLYFALLFRPTAGSLSEDAEVLIRTKAVHLVGPTGRLNDWTGGTKSPCNWTGIACDPSTLAVTAIDLSSLGLTGTFPSGFCNITTLRTLSLGDNFLNGTVTSGDVTHCFRLRHLNLSLNNFVGDLPDVSVEFGNLIHLDLSRNNFLGEIPRSFGSRFPSLKVLNLFANVLDGRIPSFLGNLTELVEFNLAYNPFEPGPLPPEIGNLSKLENLWMPFSNLVREIPTSIGNLRKLKNLDLSENELTGSIPDSIGGLVSVEQIELYRNRLSGKIPESLGNLSSLLRFDASENSLSGRVPEKVAGLHLVSLGLNDNFLEGEIPASISFNPNLIELKLFNNSFSGKLPEDLGRNSDLEQFDLSSNGFVGELPENLCSREKLRRLIAFNNMFSGPLPYNYGNCKSLSYIRIQNNSFTGKVPATIWSLPFVNYLEIRDNMFEGSLSSSIAGARNLTQLLISNNNFSGDLPAEICQLSQLSVLNLEGNNFSGDLPQCIAGLAILEKIELQDNKFSGRIPVGSWPVLTEMNLSGNRFSGEIPGELGNLPVLTYLDLSRNQLTGPIPSGLANLKLSRFNISNNGISGRIPTAFDTMFYLPSISGNPDLCTNSNLPPFPPCSPRTGKPVPKFSRTFLLVAAVLSAAGLVFLSVFCWFQNRRNQKEKTGKRVRTPESWKLTSFQRIGFRESEIFDHLSEDNVIGSGGSGRVYRVDLKSGQTIAVKKLWTGSREPDADRDFRAEVETLGRIRHANIVKLLFCCMAEDVRVLAYEYMENGSLGDLLHGEKGGRLLDWDRRVRIAVGAAQGLAYLHHDCVPPIVHRDVKPNNILLDGDFTAKVADFGVARMLQSEANERVMSNVAGSCGYIAPEYAYTLKVNEKSDVYSFGVVLLELVTGRKAVDPVFGEGRDIVRWLTETIAGTEEKSNKDEEELDLRFVMDSRLNPSSYEYDGMVRMLNVGLQCTSAFPMNRPTMTNVVELLKDRRHVGFVGSTLTKV